MGSLRLVAIALLLASPHFAQSSYGVGCAPSADEIRALDISIDWVLARLAATPDLTLRVVELGEHRLSSG